MDDATLAELTEELGQYVERFDDCFRSAPSRSHLMTYVRGQLSALQRKSVEPIALNAGVKPRTLQQFLGAHRWDEAAMRSRVREIVATEHSDSNGIAIIDETSFNKKGTRTVGVQRQWCGHTGKIDNCVQTVHLTYAARDFATIVDSDLYLPESWADDPERRIEGGVPEALEFRKKWEIALEMLARSQAEGLQIRWVTADEFYGRVGEFLAAVDALEMQYVVEIPVCTWGWSARGYARGTEHRRVDELFIRGGPSWVDYYVKDTTKGPVVWRVRATRFVSHADPTHSEKWLIIATNPLDGKTKYFLSNAPEHTPISTLLAVAFTRWRIEHNFEESKQELGLDHFEVRNYLGLQRHLAISMVSMLFLVRASRLLREKTAEHWTVPQSRLIVDTLVDGEITMAERKRRLDLNIYKIRYWQRRALVAERCHREKRILNLEKVGINIDEIEMCPNWPGDIVISRKKLAL